MTAPDHTIKPLKNFLRERGHPYMRHFACSRLQGCASHGAGDLEVVKNRRLSVSSRPSDRPQTASLPLNLGEHAK